MSGQDMDFPPADEEQASMASSEPLLKEDDRCDDTKLSHSRRARSSRYNPSHSDQPRWSVFRRDFYHDEKLMRQLKSRSCARFGRGTLIFL